MRPAETTTAFSLRVTVVAVDILGLVCAVGARYWRGEIGTSNKEKWFQRNGLLN
jgi:hypothetical protein